MKAIALVTQSIIQSNLKGWLERACTRAGAELAFHNVTESTKEYSELFRTHDNVITWNCRLPHSWLKKWGNNVLFVENSLLSQAAGIFIDSAGFFNNSNLCRLATWQQDHVADLDAFTKKQFEWGAMAGGMPDGPVLVCLQSSKDSNMNQQFPLAAANPDKLGASIDILTEHLPRGRKITIRPHPRFLDEWKAGNYPIRDDWTVSSEGNFKDILPEHSALVTVNSTCAHEAVTLGLPVATIGVGAFSGSGATLECGEDPSTLDKFFDWKPDIDRCTKYAKAILARHFMPYKTEGDPPNIELERWLARLK